MMAAAYFLAFLSAAAATVPELPVADRCAVIAAVLHSQAKMPVSGLRTLDVRFPDIVGVRNRVHIEGRPVVKADWHVRRDYQPMFTPSRQATCGRTAFRLLADGPEHINNAHDLVLLITISPVANHRTRFAFEEKLGRNPSFRFGPGVGGIAIPAMKYSGVVEKASGAWTAAVNEARFVE
jgi:hypothetical protein